LNILKDEFLNVPVRHITNVFEKHKTLLKAYEALEDQNINYQPGISPFVRLKKARGERNSRPTTTTELQAARRNSNIKAGKLIVRT
jgi:TRIAD3 protein (E3 ubiquitin-protein ligase RNF216)